MKKSKKLKRAWKKARKSAHAALFEAGKVWIGQTRDGRWSFFGGQLDKGESGKQGCFREVHEESGVKIKLGGWVQTAIYGAGKMSRVYAGWAKKIKMKLSYEHRRARLVSIKKAMKMIIKRQRRALKELVNQRLTPC